MGVRRILPNLENCTQKEIVTAERSAASAIGCAKLHLLLSFYHVYM
jgi:hypothetical protein